MEDFLTAVDLTKIFVWNILKMDLNLLRRELNYSQVYTVRLN